MKRAEPIPDGVTEKMNAVIDAVGVSTDRFIVAAARQVFERVEWRRVDS